MPRHARVKGGECTYHIMVRSISELYPFTDFTDKDKYLYIMKKYQDTYRFKVYSYCIMDNHAHFEIYANGADISKIMHGINFSYAQYYNRKYGRHGHLFQDRFKSSIVDTESYLTNLSGYIHNNPKKIKKYENCIEQYPYSSLGIYLGLRKDKFKLVDPSIVLESFSRDIILARHLYMKAIENCTEENDIYDTEFKNELTQYRSEKSILIREYSIKDITAYVSMKVGIKENSIGIKHCHKTTEMRAICAFFFRCFCNLRCKDICRIMGNITQSRVSKLCSMGLEIINSGGKYNGMIEEFIDKYKPA